MLIVALIGSLIICLVGVYRLVVETPAPFDSLIIPIVFAVTGFIGFIGNFVQLKKLDNNLYRIEVRQDKVYYKQIFNPHSLYSINYKGNANEINKYLTEEDDTNITGEWKGNHKFVNNIRNKMTHRNSPNIAVLSDFDINFKHHTSFLLKRIIEDYNVVSMYISEILDKAEEEVMKDFAQMD